jgi:hypothetical protein
MLVDASTIASLIRGYVLQRQMLRSESMSASVICRPSALISLTSATAAMI